MSSRLLRRTLGDDAGQDLIEYALLAAFVSLVAAGGVTLLGLSIERWYGSHANTVTGFRSTP